MKVEKREIKKDRDSLIKRAIEKKHKPIYKELIIDEENRF